MSTWKAGYEAAANHSAWTWAECDELTMEGADAVQVLHKLCSNDIAGLSEGQGREAFVCNVQGKIVGHVWAYRTLDGLRLNTMAGEAEALIAHLDRYVIREDVQFEKQPDRTLYLFGPQADAQLETLGLTPPSQPLNQTSIQWEGHTGWVRKLQWTHGFQIVGNSTDLESAVAKPLADMGAASMEQPAWDAWRIEAFLPEFGRDITDGNLPQEVGRDTLAISFTKGCYLGQETVARIDALGHVNRLLCGLQFPTDAQQLPSVGGELRLDGKAVGKVTSACFSPALNAPLALAYIRRSHIEPGVRLSSDCGEATVVALPVPR